MCLPTIIYVPKDGDSNLAQYCDPASQHSRCSMNAKGVMCWMNFPVLVSGDLVLKCESSSRALSAFGRTYKACEHGRKWTPSEAWMGFKSPSLTRFSSPWASLPVSSFFFKWTVLRVKHSHTCERALCQKAPCKHCPLWGFIYVVWHEARSAQRLKVFVWNSRYLTSM